MQRFSDALADAGVDGLPRSHNFPPGQESTPLNAASVRGSIDLVGYDYYNKASASTRVTIMRRTSELAVRSEALGVPSFACEMGAGYPPFFPPLEERDSVFTILTALAYGLKGFNLYMAVERDRWIGAPIDRFGARRPSFDFWQKLNQAVLRTRLAELTRAADVCVVVPRSMHRLERLLHAFGPISAAAFDVMGLGAYDSCLEQGPLASALFEAEAFLRGLLIELGELGIAYSVAGDDAAAITLEQCRFGFVVSAGGLEPELWQALRDVVGRGRPLFFGPELPTSSPRGEALPSLPDTAPSTALTLAEIPLKLAELGELHAPHRLPLGHGLRSALYRDDAGKARLLFVTNTTATPQIATMQASYLVEAVDALDGETFRATVGALEVPLSPHSVRMLELK